MRRLLHRRRLKRSVRCSRPARKRRLLLESMEQRRLLAANQVVFVDPTVWTQGSAPEDLPAVAGDVVFLDADRDGIQQMADYLEGRKGIDAVHVVSHGDAGSVSPLGNAALDARSLAGYAPQLATIGGTLSDSGDILLWGCSVSHTAATDFVRALADATGADVAASDDITGSPSLGADWDLEYTTGPIEGTNFLAMLDPQITLSHFRGGSVTHTVDASGRVELEVFTLWRDNVVNVPSFRLYSGPSQTGSFLGFFRRESHNSSFDTGQELGGAFFDVARSTYSFDLSALGPGSYYATWSGSARVAGGNNFGQATWELETKIVWDGQHAASSPTLLPATIDIVAQGHAYNQNLNSRDPDGTPLGYEFLVGASDPDYGPQSEIPGINLDTLGNVSISASNTAGLSQGRWVYKVRVTDGQGAYADRDVMVVVEDPTNPTDPNPGAPNLSPIGPKTVAVGSPLAFNATGSDTGSGQRPVTVRAQLLPPGATFPAATGGTTATSTFSWTPQPGDEGTYFVNFEAFDDESVPIIDNELVPITVTGANDPPVLDPIGSRTVANGGTINFAISGSDADGDNVAFNAFFLPAGATFDSSTRTFSWTPSPAQYDNTFFTTFRVTDDGTPHLFDEEVVAITVGAGNQPPVFTPIPDQTLRPGQTLSVPVTVSDAAGQAVEITSMLQPTGSTFTSAPGNPPVTGSFQWTPTLADAGTHTVRLRAEDDGSPILSSTEEFVITVVTNAAPNADAGGPYTIDEGDPVTLDASSSSDPDGAVLSYAWDLDNDGEYDDATGVAPALTATQLASLGLGSDGTYPIGLLVDDGNGEQATASAAITVENVAPTLADLAVTPEVEENDYAALTGKITDPGAQDTFTLAISWGDGATNTISLGASSVNGVDVNGDLVTWNASTRAFDVKHQYLDDAPTATASDEYTITVTSLKDDAGESAQGALRPNVMLSGSSWRDVTTFFPAGTSLNLVSGSIPDHDTQALLVTRSGLSGLNATALQSYLDDGGIVITEYSITNSVFNLAFDENVSRGSWHGDCSDQINPSEQLNLTDPFWQTLSGVTPQASNLEGCGYSVDAYPGITPLGGWGNGTVQIAYRDRGLGRLWLVEADWQDGESGPTRVGPYGQSETIMGHMITHGGATVPSVTVRVNNVVPELPAQANESLAPGAAGKFTRTVNFADAGTLDVWAGTVNFGDGSGDQPLSIDQATGSFDLDHTYLADGTYPVSVTVEDDDLGSTTHTFNVTVILNTPPNADAGGAYTIKEGSGLAFDATGSTDAENNITSYAWDLDDDGQFDDATGASPNLSWNDLLLLGINDDGVFPVAVQVTDAFGAYHTSASTLRVQNADPQLQNIAVDSPIHENGIATLSGDIIDPGTQDTFTLTVDWGDGSAVETFTYAAGTTSFSETHQYLDDSPTGTPSDTYELTFSFSDDDGTGAGQAFLLTERNASAIWEWDTSTATVYHNVRSNDIDLNPSEGSSDAWIADHFSDHFGRFAPGTGNGLDQQYDLGASGRTHYHYPKHIAVYSGDVYVMSRNNGEIFRYDSNGNELGAISTGFHTGQGLATDGTHLFASVWDGSSSSFLKYDAALNLVATVANPGGLGSFSNVFDFAYDAATGNFFGLATTGEVGTRTATSNVVEFQMGGSVVAVHALGFSADGIGQNGTAGPAPVSGTLDVVVDNVAPVVASVSLSQATISENDSVTVSGSVTDAGTLDTHTVEIDFGDGSAPVTVPVDPATRTYSATHQYLDDAPTGTAQDLYTISVTASDDDGGVSTAATAVVTVNNVPPQLQNVVITSPIAENGVAILSGNIIDPGSEDAFTLTVDWGDGSPVETFSYAAGSASFSQGHQYLDDNPSGTPSDAYNVLIQITDDDGGSGAAGGGGTGSVVESDPNDSVANAQSLDAAGWGLAFDADIGDTTTNTSTDIPHITVSGTGDSTVDVYAFTVANAGDRAIFDVDDGMNDFDPWLRLLNAGGSILAENDDAPTAYGQGGSVHPYDSYLEYTFTAAGTYYIAVGRYPSLQPIPAGADYRLHVSLENHPASTSVPLNVQNVSPTIGPLSLSSASIDENGSVTLSGTFTDPGTLDEHTVTINWGDGSSETVTLATGDRSFSLSHQYLDDSPTGTASDVYGIGVTLTDDDTGSDTASTTVTVNNLDPVIVSVNAPMIDEDGTATIAGAFTDTGTLDTHTVVIDWGDGTTSSATVDPVARTFTADHQYLDDNPTGTASDVYSIGVTLTDDDTGSDSETTTVTVENVAPEITRLTSGAEHCGNAHEDTPITLELDFSDAGTLDEHTVVIEWGDGTSETVILPVGSRTLSIDHDYVDGGVYTIDVSVTDDDTGTESASRLAVVSGVGLHDGVLQIVGTAVGDRVTLNQTGNGTLRVHADFIADHTRNFSLADIDRILMVLCDGDDHATISSRVTLDAIIDGGAGNDHLNGGDGSTLILGGSGNDHINGGSNRDILIGGIGADRIIGNPGTDLLSGGDLRAVSSGDSDTIANEGDLLVARDRWQSATDGEIDAWREGTDDFFAGLDLELADDEGAADKLTGSSADDWFALFANDVAAGAVSPGNGKGNVH